VSASLPERVAVYGAGTFGRELADRLVAKGIEVPALLDRGASGWHRGQPIVHPQAQTWTLDLPVVLGIHNPGTPPRQLRDELLALCHPEVLSSVRVMHWLGSQGLHAERYWLSSEPQLPPGAGNLLARVRALLVDDASRVLLDQLVEYRTHGELSAVPEPLPLAEQYFPPDLLERLDLRRVLDCGAFDGDTLRALAARSIPVEWVICMEPDPASFGALARAARRLGLPALCLPLGAWDSTGPVGFTADGSAAAAVTAQGPTQVQAVALDALLGDGWAPSYVKMDIEGAELAALSGARQTIERHRPTLALSVYHRPADLWEIPLWVAEQPGYDLFLRQYGENCFETVLYALPQEAA
jgi:FkbM family methyltransferase